MNNSTENPPIVLEDVSITFGDRIALDQLSLSFPRGVTTMLIGTSGSGKSLTLKSAAGLLFPDEGKVFFEGCSIAAMNEVEYRDMQSRTGFMFQDAALWANKSLRENLSLPLLASDEDISDTEIEHRIMAAFDSVSLKLDPDYRPSTISMGQRKMVSFLRAVITSPEILFLDEPTVFLDHGGVRQLLARVEEFKAAGRTVIVSTENRLVSERLADRVVVVSQGRLAASGKYDELMSSDDPAVRLVLRDLT